MFRTLLLTDLADAVIAAVPLSPSQFGKLIKTEDKNLVSQKGLRRFRNSESMQ